MQVQVKDHDFNFFFPNEIKAQVFSHCSFPDLIKCLTVCKVWKEIIENPRVNLMTLSAKNYFSHYKCLQRLGTWEDMKQKLTNETTVLTQENFHSADYQNPKQKTSKFSSTHQMVMSFYSTPQKLYGGTDTGLIIIWDHQTKKMERQIQISPQPINLIRICQEEIWVEQQQLNVFSLEGKFIKEITINNQSSSSSLGKILSIKENLIIGFKFPTITTYDRETQISEVLNLKDELQIDKPCLAQVKGNQLFTIVDNLFTVWNLKTKTPIHNWNLEALYKTSIDGKIEQIASFTFIFHQLAVIELKAKSYHLQDVFEDTNYVDNITGKTVLVALHSIKADFKKIAIIDGGITSRLYFKNGKLFYCRQNPTSFKYEVKSIDYAASDSKVSQTNEISKSSPIMKLVRKLSFRKKK